MKPAGVYGFTTLTAERARGISEIRAIFGGLFIGPGSPLPERLDFDLGYRRTTHFDEYLIPTAMDVSEFVGDFVEVPFAPGPYGAEDEGLCELRSTA